MTATLAMTRAWMPYCLILAGIYNVVWGAVVILSPRFVFELAGVSGGMMPNPVGLAIWQCVGMIVGVYGVGYVIAATNPLRHWPIVLVGLLGKVFGPIGYVYSAFVMKNFPTEFWWTIVTNDLVWWVPFGAILIAARRAHLACVSAG